MDSRLPANWPATVTAPPSLSPLALGNCIRTTLPDLTERPLNHIVALGGDLGRDLAAKEHAAGAGDGDDDGANGGKGERVRDKCDGCDLWGRRSISVGSAAGGGSACSGIGFARGMHC